MGVRYMSACQDDSCHKSDMQKLLCVTDKVSCVMGLCIDFFSFLQGINYSYTCRMDPFTEEPGPSSNANDSSEVENPASSPGTATQLDIDTIQMEIDRWEEYYDHIKHYLVHGSLQKNSKSVQKSVHNYLIGSDGQLYRNKTSKDGVTCTKVLVIRSYEDRLRICKDIHVNTGEEGRHHRRDKMLEIIGRQYYWKGQRRDICECVSLLMSMLVYKCYYP